MEKLASGDMTSEGSCADEEQKKITDPKLYKTSLCQFYLKGPCKNGDSCSYAHGTSELRSMTGGSIAEIESGGKKSLFKTTLCAKFVTFGECPFGLGCNFAHGVKELQMSLNASTVMQKEEEEKAKSNPSYKTTLCKNYIAGLFCQFAEKCQYAHGQQELREKPKLPPASQLPEEVKKKLTEKAKALPGYKTKLCTNFDNDGNCQYEDMCHFAHGEEELREETEVDREMAMQMKIKKNPFYKTIMCKSLPDCQFAENCVYAHTEDEIRSIDNGGGTANYPAAAMRPGYKTSLCKNFSEGGECSFGPKCTFAHGSMDLRSNPINAAQQTDHPMFKTSMCRSIMNMGTCTHGSNCRYAHSQQELRKTGPGTGMNMVGSRMIPPTNSNIMVQGSDGRIKFKTSMCTVFIQEGYCPRGDACGFAHSAKQLLAAQAQDPKYKTSICESWKTNGTCERGNNCIYAHGENDLRQKQGGDRHINMIGNSMQTMNPRYKTSMCIAFAKNGYCQNDEGCQYAHGPHELRGNTGGGMSMMMRQTPNLPSTPDRFGGPNNFKTAMCKNILEQGHCPRGNSCHFAHSSAELRSKKPSPLGMMQQASPSPMGTGGMFKRKRENLKASPCQTFTAFGECQYGDSCVFAHGPQELAMAAMNKRQRF